MDKKVDISGHVPVIPSISNKSVNSKRDIGRRGVVDIVPQLIKDKAFIFKVKNRVWRVNWQTSFVSCLTTWLASISHLIFSTN